MAEFDSLFALRWNRLSRFLQVAKQPCGAYFSRRFFTRGPALMPSLRWKRYSGDILKPLLAAWVYRTKPQYLALVYQNTSPGNTQGVDPLFEVTVYGEAPCGGKSQASTTL